LLSLGYGCGLRASEVVRLKVKHIDSAQKIIRIEQSKGRKRCYGASGEDKASSSLETTDGVPHAAAE
jgi:integrase